VRNLLTIYVAERFVREKRAALRGQLFSLSH